jgi:hypothetical protein
MGRAWARCGQTSPCSCSARNSLRSRPSESCRLNLRPRHCRQDASGRSSLAPQCNGRPGPSYRSACGCAWHRAREQKPTSPALPDADAYPESAPRRSAPRFPPPTAGRKCSCLAKAGTRFPESRFRSDTPSRTGRSMCSWVWRHSPLGDDDSIICLSSSSTPNKPQVIASVQREMQRTLTTICSRLQLSIPLSGRRATGNFLGNPRAVCFGERSASVGGPSSAGNRVYRPSNLRLALTASAVLCRPRPTPNSS